MLPRPVGLLVLIIHLALSQNPSPCPEVFSYEPRGQEQDRWFGIVYIQSAEDLDGIWLKIILDRPAEILGNWFGEASSIDNQEFEIKNAKYKLQAGPPVPVKFFVKYNAASTVPSVKNIKLNGKTICTTRKDELVTTTSKLHISQVRPTSRPTGKPSNEDTFINLQGTTERPGSSFGGSSQERPSSSSSSRPGSVSSAGSRPSGSSSSGVSRPSTGSGSSNNNFGGSSQERPSSSSNNNNYNTQQSSSQSQGGNRRPSGSRPQSTSYNKQREPDTQTGTHYNGLSYEEGSSTNTNGFDYFPGDFAFPATPSHKPTPRPNGLNKRQSQCGTVAMKPSPLISYGQNTTQGQWPWHAAIYYAQGAQLMYTCGATLISENHILTAGHCVARPQSRRPIDTRKLAVYLGKYSLKKFGSGIQDREVSDIYIHPQYNFSNYFNDIAILKLKEPIDITNYVRPCCLWEDGIDIENVISKFGTVVGWGFDENRQISESLMQAQMPVVSNDKCIYSNREFFSQFTFEKNFCAGFRNGTTVCNGDSGGGMVFPKKGTSGHNTIWQIRGIVSVGVALQGQGVCDPSQYIVFTDVAKHLDWIRDVMNN